jgi:long-chain acyl-CoA synthetase
MGADTPGMLTDVSYIFNLGLQKSGDKPFLGRRPIVSQNPLQFADHYVWETYKEVDVRRKAVGSALRNLFTSGQLKAGKYETVGIWSINRPGRWLSFSFIHLLTYLQNGRSLTWVLRRTA